MTIFHKIIRREIPADIVYEDDDIIAFRDIAPQAPVHVLFVPKTDVATLNDLQSGQAEIVGRLALAAARYAKEQGFAEDGYRIVMNCNRSEEHTSELQSLMRISYAVFCLKKKTSKTNTNNQNIHHIRTH